MTGRCSLCGTPGADRHDFRANYPRQQPVTYYLCLQCLLAVRRALQQKAAMN